MKHRPFSLVLVLVSLLVMLASAQVGATMSVPPAAGALPQGLLATPTLSVPRGNHGASISSSPLITSSVYLPMVLRDAQPPLPPIIPPTTKPLTTDTTQYLSSVSGDGVTFTFSQTTSQLNALAAGNVIVGDEIGRAHV